MCVSSGNLAKPNYMDIKQLLDRRIVQNKRGTLTSGEVKLLVPEIHDQRQEDKLPQHTADKEMSAMQRNIQQYNVKQLGEMPSERKDSMMRILVCQLGGCTSTKIREI
jgi:hypothetical protein